VRKDPDEISNIDASGIIVGGRRLVRLSGIHRVSMMIKAKWETRFVRLVLRRELISVLDFLRP
jgi:hypothetical protein